MRNDRRSGIQRNITSNRNGRGGRNDNNSKNILVIAVAVVAMIIVAVYFISSGDKKKLINDERNIAVTEVLNGNTVKLSDGLTVTLLGVQNTPESQSFLKDNVLNKYVTLIADSHDAKNYFEDPTKDHVRAYLKMEGTSFSNVNGYILGKGLSHLNPDYVQDSLIAFQSYVSGKLSNIKQTKNSDDIDGQIMSKTELSKRMYPATFLIVANNDEGTSLGTGFFISKTGLAVTNFHVLNAANSKENLVVFLSDENGKITSDRNRPFGRVVYYNQKYDFAIFTVQLDNSEESACLSLAKNRPEVGTEICVVGNPQGLTGTFTSGQISALREDEGSIQFNAPVTHGNSGGPICDLYGRVVGVVKSVYADSQGNESLGDLNFGVDVMLIRQALSQLSDVKEYAGK